MNRSTVVPILLAIFASLVAPQLYAAGIAFAADTPSRYETRAIHDPEGIGKFYMGREIADVMGAEGIAWLERPEREAEEQPSRVLSALHVKPGDVVADLGAGSGYFTFRLAKLVGDQGKVLAVDIEPKMLNAMRARAAQDHVSNIALILGTETDPKLPANSLDLVLMVDVYHELAYPYEVMAHVRDALKPGGTVVLVEYRAEDPAVNIKEVHKMRAAQMVKEMAVLGLKPIETVESLPQQHLILFGK